MFAGGVCPMPKLEARVGPDFKAKDFHDFVLDQGLLPPPLLRQAVMEKFTA